MTTRSENSLFQQPLKVLNLGLRGFADDLEHAVDEPQEAAVPADSGDAGGVQSKQADESEAPAGPSEDDRRLAAFHAQRLRRLDWLFRKHAADPWMTSVRGVLEAYHVKKLACLPGSGGDAP